MSRYQVFADASLSTATNTAYLVGSNINRSVHIITLMCKGDFDQGQVVLQMGASNSAGTLRWNDIASTTLSADGQVNVEMAAGFYVRVMLRGVSAAASQSTSVDGWLAMSPYIK